MQVENIIFNVKFEFIATGVMVNTEMGWVEKLSFEGEYVGGQQVVERVGDFFFNLKFVPYKNMSDKEETLRCCKETQYALADKLYCRLKEVTDFFTEWRSRCLEGGIPPIQMVEFSQPEGYVVKISITLEDPNNSSSVTMPTSPIYSPTLKDNASVKTNSLPEAIYLVWNNDKTEGFFTTDKQIAYEARKGAESNCFSTSGDVSLLAQQFCEIYSWEEDCTLQTVLLEQGEIDTPRFTKRGKSH